MNRIAFPTLAAVLFIAALCTHPASAQSPPDTQPDTHAQALALRVAKAHGLDDWPNVARLRFTFNVHLNPDKQIQRTWDWDVANHTVSRTVGDTTQTLDLTDLDAAPSDTLHSQFINDTYWLLFPFQLAWSTYQPTLHPTPQPAPLSGEPSTRLDIAYPQGGYTPGDTYRLYLNEKLHLRAWEFVRGDAPPRPATWDQRTALGPITLYLDHQGANGFRLFFTDVQLTTRDGHAHQPATQPADNN